MKHAPVFCALLFASALSAATIQVPRDAQSIPEALQKAKMGDVVLVAAGTYRGDLKLKNGVTLQSAGNDKKGQIGLLRAEATILEGSIEMAEKAILDGFSVTQVGKYDEQLWKHHFETKGEEQDHQSIGAAGTPGIAVATTCQVRHNIVHHIGYTGIAITAGSPLIVGNVCYRNMGGGIGSMSGSTARIEKNLCFENFYAGIGCDSASPLIQENTCHSNIRAGIGISEGSSPQVLSNRCDNNRRAGIGIRTGSDTRPVIKGNECRGNEMAGIGIEEGAQPEILNNRLIDNKLVAIGISGGSRAIITHNELRREGGMPPLIAVLEDSQASITQNTLHGGGVAAIVVKGAADISRNHFVIPGPKKHLLAFPDAQVTESENMLLTDTAFRSTLDGTEQRYVQLHPIGDKKPRTALIALHGHGSDRWQFIRDTRGECQGLRDVAAKHGLLFISPDYRAKTSWMGPAAEADVLQIITQLRQQQQIDRIFIAGGSMGGTSALIFTVLHPDLIAGVCSLNGTANMIEYAGFKAAIDTSYGSAEQRRIRSAELHAQRLSTLPVALTTGGKDTIVPPASTLRLAKQLPRVLHIHRDSGGHSTSYADTVQAMEFLLKQRP
ncbi:MAG: right-handed parallel beta-helix repeat-containing protein [Verrucomicrobiaceae bacterium]|nr:right-handed parallel beta-helix repeat-containing protein [Verrucomicrobiaceae bacterium]